MEKLSRFEIFTAGVTTGIAFAVVMLLIVILIDRQPVKKIKQ